MECEGILTECEGILMETCRAKKGNLYNCPECGLKWLRDLFIVLAS
jgi:predicted RNA-binding Zn-ribbon protein involved in translation (DUF1610 family)